VEGDIDCLKDPEKVMVPRSLADKLFGEDISAVGKTLRAEENIWTKSAKLFTIGAVYKDFPENTQLRNVVYTAIDPDYNINNFSSSNWVCYLLLDNPAMADEVADNFNRHFDFKKIYHEGEQIRLVPLTDIYYMNETQDGGTFRSGNKEVTALLFGIALLIVIVAAINFTNFSTSLTPLRIKSINTQKVLGSSDTLLRRSLLIEAALISFMAWLVSLVIVWGLDWAEALPFIEADLSLVSNLPIVFLCGIVALVIGWLAGIYPAYYITSFPPALVLKGSFGLSPSGRKLRTTLICVQFVVSIVLIIGACFVQIQNSYMRNFSLGFDKDQVAIVELNETMYNKHHDTYVNRLKENPGIEDVAFAMEKVGSKDGYNTNGGNYKGKDFQYFIIIASSNFLRVMGIPVIEGRDFSKADELSDHVSYIFNRTAMEGLDMQVGDAFDSYSSGHLVGFSDDVKFTSLRGGEDNIAFLVGNFGYSLPISYIRLKAGSDIHAVVGHIQETMRELDPSYPFNIEFYDEIFNHLYRKEENLRSLVTVFSLLAIIISLVGVFGLVVFETQYRRKEIGIRKVHGATVGEILLMFNKAYLRIVGICFVIAAPIAWQGVRMWLEGFAYKTPIHGWVFLIALLIVTVITLLTVSFQNWKAANENPVNSIKSE
jgi:ABC-type transport system, involved in lipoprotein release, permease component